MEWRHEGVAKDTPEKHAEQKTRYSDGDAKADHGKIRYDLVPVNAEEGIARVFTYGAQKYDDYNWLKSEHPERYYAAARRHMAAMRRGEWLDRESDLPHVDHALVSLIMYRELVNKLSSQPLQKAQESNPLVKE